MTGDPSFTIVIPTFQRREVVCDAVKHAARLTYAGEVELIVVVDGSTDGTTEALANLTLPFPVKVIEQANSGPAAARNRGAKEATGEILLFLDDDMMSTPNLLEEHARMYREGADAVVGYIPEDIHAPPNSIAPFVQGWGDMMVTQELSNHAVIAGQFSVKRSIFRSLGGFDESYTSGSRFGSEDADFGMKLTKHDVRHNAKAISRHRYVLTAREKIRRAPAEGAADALFALRYPRLTKEVFPEAFRPIARFLFRPLSRVPLVPALLSEAAIAFSNIALKTRYRSWRPVARFYWAARWILYWSSMRNHGAPLLGERILTLCYHGISDLSGDLVLSQYGIDPEAFASQLDSLRARGFAFVTPEDLIALLSGVGTVPDRAVLLTFDDCYEELVDVARDILRPRGISAIAFAVSGMRSGTNEWDQKIGARHLRLLTSDGLRELSGLGVEIGCHSRSHAYLPSLSDEALESETRSAADDLEKLGLPRPRFFAYPHGMHDRRSRIAVRSADFAAAFGLSRKHVTRKSDRFDLPRIEILARDRGWRFNMKTRWPRLAPLFSPLPLVARLENAAGRVLRG